VPIFQGLRQLGLGWGLNYAALALCVGLISGENEEERREDNLGLEARALKYQPGWLTSQTTSRGLLGMLSGTLVG